MRVLNGQPRPRHEMRTLDPFCARRTMISEKVVKRGPNANVVPMVEASNGNGAGPPRQSSSIAFPGKSRFPG